MTHSCHIQLLTSPKTHHYTSIVLKHLPTLPHRNLCKTEFIPQTQNCLSHLIQQTNIKFNQILLSIYLA